MKVIILLFAVLVASVIYIWRGIRAKRLSGFRILTISSGLLLLFGVTGIVFQKRFKMLYFLAAEYIPFKISDIRPCSCNFVGQLSKDDYFKHRSLARKVTGHRFIKNNTTRQKFIQQKHLVKVENNEGYRIGHLTHSSAHLTRHAYDRLKEIGIRFKASIKSLDESEAYFVVSSLSRTEHTEQQDLRKIQKNATSGISSHSYGVSFDIEKIKTPGNCFDIQLRLKKVLQEMQAENKILICPETNCTHVTVIN